MTDKLNKLYLSKGIETEVSKEFETNIGKELKEMAKKGTLDPILKGLLFAADRQIRLREILKEDIENKILLFDRYVPSAIAYRMAEGIDKEWVTNINSVFPKHDIGFYIDISPAESIRRNTDAKFNIRASEEHLSKVREAYMSILEENKLIYINGMQSIDIIFKEIAVKIEEKRLELIKEREKNEQYI